MMLENWIETVRRKFRDGVPNGWLLSWDTERFFNELKSLVCKGEFINSTSFDYSFCNTYKAFFPSQNSEKYEMATIQISFIVNAYQIFWTSYTKFGKAGKVISEPSTIKEKETEIKIRNLLEAKGFNDCPADCYNMKIQGVELELSEKDNIILGHCLFDDFED